MFISIAHAMGSAPSGGSAQSGNPIMNMFPLIALFVIFYFFLIRPQQRRAKDHQRMLTALKQNDKVVTSGGIYGVIVGVDSSVFHLKISDNVTIKVTKDSISKRIVQEAEIVK